MEENSESVKSNEKKGITRRGERCAPEDIARDILLRLPTKSLVRFKSVCKNWNSMISDHSFEDNNFLRLVSKIGIVCRTDGAEPTKNVLFKLEERGTRARKVTSLCLEGKGVEKSCNSLLLLEFGFQPRRLYLYDIITHQQKQLPEIPILGYFTRNSSLIFDESGQTYKAVVFYLDNGFILKTCYIYTLNLQNWKKEENWRKSKPPRSQKIGLFSFSSVALNGIFYWIADTIASLLRRAVTFIQPMNIATEEFMKIIQLPFKPRREFCKGNCKLLVIKGSLCLTYAASDDELELWVFKNSVKSVWINQYKISLSSIVNRPYNLYDINNFLPMLSAESCNNRTTYILVYHYPELYWYNMDTQEMRLIDVESDSGWSPHLLSLMDSSLAPHIVSLID